MKKAIASFLLLTFCTPGILQAQDFPWEFRGTPGGIPIYTRKVEGSSILEYKASVVIDAPMKKVLELFEDEKQIRRWYFQCVRSELVEKDGPQEEIIYLILHFPWPVAARDFVFRRTRSEDADKGTVEYSLTALPHRLPEVKGMIRVNSIQSVWRFKSLSAGRTEITFQQHTDPGGSIPPSIVNQLAVQTPYNSLKNFRKLVTQKSV